MKPRRTEKKEVKRGSKRGQKKEKRKSRARDKGLEAGSPWRPKGQVSDSEKREIYRRFVPDSDA